MWERGHFELPNPSTMLNNHTVLLAGTKSNFASYDKDYGNYNTNNAAVIIIGAGRVGRETAKALDEADISYKVIESDKKGFYGFQLYWGDASDKSVLERAGINKSPAIIITSHDDETNVYLTIYSRKLRPDIQIITRFSS